ncbi:MAG: hypothetical protein WCS43_13260, partial [Verrucomicrobiota bacterium]
SSGCARRTIAESCFRVNSLAEDFLQKGQHAAAAAHPVVEAIETLGDEFSLLRIFDVRGGLAEALDLGFAAFQVRPDLLADEAADEAFEFDGGFVIGPSFGGSNDL